MKKKNFETKFSVTNSDLTRSIKILDSEANEISFLVSAYRSLKIKLKSNSQTLKVSAVSYGNVRLRKYKNTEFVWELRRGFGKATVSRAVRSRLRECALRELPLYKNTKRHHYVGVWSPKLGSKDSLDHAQNDAGC